MSSALGVMRAVVADNEDPQQQKRVRLIIPQIFGDVPSEWAEPAVSDVAVPKTGSTVWSAFNGGDIHRPVYFAGSAPPDLSGYTTDAELQNETNWRILNDNDHNNRITSLEGADKAAATASIRTLGTGAQQASPGTHSHTGIAVNERRRFAMQMGMMGGGAKRVTIDGSGNLYLTWSAPFVVGPVNDVALHFQISFPPNGTTVPFFNSTTSGLPVQAGSIRIGKSYDTWSLWYIPPWGQTDVASVPGNFRLVLEGTSGVSSTTAIPDDWIFVCGRQEPDATVVALPQVKWGDGTFSDVWRLPTLTNGWTQYGAPWGTELGYRKENNRVEMRGLIQGGTVGAAAFVLPVGYRPVDAVIIGTASNSAYGEIRIYSDGSVTPVTGSNLWFTLADCHFVADA